MLAGKMAASKVRGIQSQNIAACVKHLCVNNKETNRTHSDSRLSERALRVNRAEPYREFLAGNNLRMPYSSLKRMQRALKAGKITREDLVPNARKILELLLRIQ